MNKNLPIIIFASVMMLAFIAVGMNQNARHERAGEKSNELSDSLLGIQQRDEKVKAGQPVLETCSVCNGKISSDATKCPHCGDPR